MTGVRRAFREWADEEPMNVGLIAGIFVGGGAATGLYATPEQTTVFLAALAAIILGATAVVAARNYAEEATQ